MTETLLDIKHVVKRFNGITAVDDLSFEVHAGEIFGLLGPNGAGKTTTIRIIMDILKADEGSVTVLGRPPAAARELVGYLPEERGLYRDLRLVDLLVYLGRLKGMEHGAAHHSALRWLERVELDDRAHSKVKDLSRGMQQKLQFAAALIHNPALAILDEPFQGLDPVNVGLLKRLIRDLQAEGKTILLSAHEMSLVEELCDRIVLINRGKAVLYGPLEQIRREHSPNTVRLRTSADLTAMPGIASIQQENGVLTVTLDSLTPPELLRRLVEMNATVDSFEVALAPLEDIFIMVVREGSDA